MGAPSQPQLERHIRLSAKDSVNVVFTLHARKRMKQRHINDPMVLEVLRLGQLVLPPEPDSRHSGLLCRMQRFVAGVQAAAVVNVDYPASGLVVVTVIDVKRD